MSSRGRETAKPGFFETPALHPNGKGKTTALVPRAKLEHYLKYGPAYKFYEIKYLVRETLCDPGACFRYKKDEFPGYCYTRNITYRYTNGGCKVPSASGLVFVVFLTDKMILGDFGWESCDECNPLRPQTSEGRLEKVLWCED